MSKLEWPPEETVKYSFKEGQELEVVISLYNNKEQEKRRATKGERE